jgi:site-specific recombinase XerD
MSLPMIGALLGHASPATTQRYAHLADSALRVGVEALGQVVAGPGR